MQRTRSEQLYAQAKKTLPGGVNSPVRAFNSVGGQPLFIERGSGPYLYDADGNRYIDYVMSWGPLILGHAHREVTAALKHALARGRTGLRDGAVNRYCPFRQLGHRSDHGRHPPGARRHRP